MELGDIDKVPLGWSDCDFTSMAMAATTGAKPISHLVIMHHFALPIRLAAHVNGTA